MAIELDATPVLETERLLLRIPGVADAAEFAVAMSDPEVMRYVGSGATGTQEDALAAIERFRNNWQADGFGVFAVDRDMRLLHKSRGLSGAFKRLC